MMLSNNSPKTFVSIERYLMLGMGLVLVVVLGWVLFRQFPENIDPPTNAIYCDAENVEEDSFFNGENEFSGGALQSNDRARSGRYSCRIGLGPNLPRGFGYVLTNVKAGEVYKASVWRYKFPARDGRLAVKGSGNSSLDIQESYPKQTDINGWELLEIQFTVPLDEVPDAIHIYVYASGLREVYFDDLSIEKVSDWLAADFKLQVLKLEIDYKNLEQLKKKREEAFRTGLLEIEDEDWVNGSITDSTGQSLPVKLRLKGDWLDHLLGDKWSFRIKVKDPYSWNRMITFSLHTPSARYHLHEWLLHQWLDKEDVLNTRYDFVELQINGQSRGIYAYEEHFEKQLVESRQRREGPILKFSEAGFWSGIKRQLEHHGYQRFGATHSAMDWQNASIEAFKQQQIEASPLLEKQYLQAQNLMYQYLNGLQTTEAVFDLERMAKYFAIADVLHAYHGIIWHNQRFYYNPVTNLLEPIGFDGYGELPPRRYSILGEGALNPESIVSGSIFAPLFQDTAFVRQYQHYLYRFSDRAYINAFFDDLQKDWIPRKNLITNEFPEYTSTLTDFLQESQYVHSLILPYQEESLKSYTESRTGGRKQLKVRNTHTLPIEVIGYGPSIDGPTTLLDSLFYLPGRTPRRVIARQRRDSLVQNPGMLRYVAAEVLEMQETAQFREMEVSNGANYLFFRTLGVDSVFRSKISNWPKPENNSARQDLQHLAKIPDSDYFLVNGKSIIIQCGKHQIRQPLILPKGYEITIAEGTQLDFIQGAFLLSYSPIQAFGNEDAPIVITSSDKSSQGFILMNTGQQSVFKHVIFEKSGNLNYKNWILTGAVSVHESPVHFYRCIFRDNHCEDALNTIRTHFTLEHCLFSNISGDAFDSDFSKGEVQYCQFRNVGNDGVDFSGSIVNISHCQMQNCGDKGISVGEESDVSVWDTQIQGSPIAVASKDLSTLFMQNIVLKDCEQGFTAFQKKPEYGCSSIIVDGFRAENVKRVHAISEGCSLQLNDQLLQ
ncbi:MAG: hypothetical protein DHS20C18_18890 [Saprospiraceae bacterium]|nr:MAG: hypothetical protein DHS20C18_18890 [Saprospiraceae bacterium]